MNDVTARQRGRRNTADGTTILNVEIEPGGDVVSTTNRFNAGVHNAFVAAPLHAVKSAPAAIAQAASAVGRVYSESAIHGTNTLQRGVAYASLGLTALSAAAAYYIDPAVGSVVAIIGAGESGLLLLLCTQLDDDADAASGRGTARNFLTALAVGAASIGAAALGIPVALGLLATAPGVVTTVRDLANSFAPARKPSADGVT